MGDSFVEIESPLEKGKMVKGKDMKFKINNLEPIICELENKDILKLIPVVNSIITPLGDDGKPLLDPKTKTQFYVFNLSITVSVVKYKGEEDANK